MRLATNNTPYLDLNQVLFIEYQIINYAFSILSLFQKSSSVMCVSLCVYNSRTAKTVQLKGMVSGNYHTKVLTVPSYASVTC